MLFLFKKGRADIVVEVLRELAPAGTVAPNLVLLLQADTFGYGIGQLVI